MIQIDEEGLAIPDSIHKPLPPCQPMKKSYLENGEQWIPEKTLQNVL
jgi:hypothetical protein